MTPAYTLSLLMGKLYRVRRKSGNRKKFNLHYELLINNYAKKKRVEPHDVFDVRSILLYTQLETVLPINMYTIQDV